VTIDKLRYRETWTGSYKGLRYEVVLHSKELGQYVDTFNGGIYCGYIKFTSKHCPEILTLRGRPDEICDRHNDFWNQFSWHGGVTFYEETTDMHGILRMELGCDYGHYMDETSAYSPESVASDLRAIIDEYRKIYPLLGAVPVEFP
jgi:hypothetical protein